MITLKAFANSSPGLRLGNPGNGQFIIEDITLKELLRPSTIKPPQLFQSCKETFGGTTFPRVSKPTLG